MLISVSAEKTVRVAPERAELNLSVEFTGPDRARAVADATATAQAVVASLKEAGVERPTVDALRTYTSQQGRAQRVTATVGVRALFTDLENLGRVVADLAEREGVRLGWVSWSLSEATENRLRDECIAGAVQRGRERAEAMARAAGASEIEITEIADPGMLGAAEVQSHLEGRPMMAMARSAKAGGDVVPDPLEVVPSDVTIGAQLQLRFVTR